MAVINGDNSGQVLIGTTSADTINAFGGDDHLLGDVGVDTLNAGAGNDILSPDAWGYSHYYYNDGLLYVFWPGAFQDDQTADHLDGGADFDIAQLQFELMTAPIVANFSNASATQTFGNGTTVVNVEQFHMILGSGADNIVFGAGNDEIYAGIGADVLSGGGGADFLSGEEGDDTLTGGSDNDQLIGGNGNDAAIFSGTRSNYSITYANQNGARADLIVTDLRGGSPDGSDAIFSVETLQFSNGSFDINSLGPFQIIGTAESDGFIGTYANDIIKGGAGNDYFEGNFGTDTFDGEAGIDVALIPLVGDAGVTFALSGNQVVDTYWGTKTLISIERGYISGTDFDDALTGGAYDDVISGGLGNDILSGLGGNDAFSDQAGDGVINGGEGTDRANLDFYDLKGVNFILSADVLARNQTGTQRLISIEEISANGSQYSDAIIGGVGADGLSGGAGNDILQGLAGADGLRADTPGYTGRLIGGAGNDTLWGNGTSTIAIFSGARSNYSITTNGTGHVIVTDLRAGSPDGTDTLQDIAMLKFSNGYLSVSAALTGGTPDARAGNNTLMGTTAHDLLDGGAGTDSFSGGLGDDTYIVDDVGDTVIENSGAGTDEVETGLGVGASQAERIANMYQLGANLEDLTGTGLNQGLQGNGLSNVIVAGAGTDYVDTTDGGSDTVNSGNGRDVIYYGGALDSGDANNGGDEGGDARGDLLVIQGNYTITLGADDLVDIEKFRVLKGSNTAFGYEGGGLFNYNIATVDGNVAAGGRLVVQGGSLQLGEHLIFNGEAETDGSFQLFGGHDSDTLTGGAGGDHILGRAGDDELTGNGGADRLRGGLGGDTMDGGTGADIFVYAAQGGDEPYSVAPLESTSLNYDTILGFNYTEDRIDMPQTVTGFVQLLGGSLSDASFDADLATAVNGALNPNAAVLFTATAGTHNGETFLVVDGDNDGSYQANLDYVIHLDAPVGTPPAGTEIFI